MPKRFLILMVILLPHLVTGQWFMDTLICPHTKWQKDSVKFTSEDLKNSPFELFRLADSCARGRDSADASEYFSKLDPYFLLYFNVNPNSLDSVFRRVSITGNARKRYRDEFKRAFDEPKTDLYDSFKTMAQVSGSTRFALWHYNVQDSSEFGIKDAACRQQPVCIFIQLCSRAWLAVFAGWRFVCTGHL